MLNGIKIMKPGYKTTEFWTSLIVSVLSTIVPFLGDFPTAAKIVGLVLAVASAMGYTAARVSIKNNSGQ